MDVPERITFVALGDSLTYGYLPHGPSGAMGRGLPYTAYLDNIVVVEKGRRGLGEIDFSFVNLGVSGDTTRGMLGRLEAEVAPRGPDYVVVWGGINDLLGGREPALVMEDLKKIYANARELGIEPIACTVASVASPGPVVLRIVELNGLIREHCEENRIRLVDLFEALSDGSGLLLGEFSSDGVHLSAGGNMRVASAIYSGVVEQILDGLVR